MNLRVSQETFAHKLSCIENNYSSLDLINNLVPTSFARKSRNFREHKLSRTNFMPAKFRENEIRESLFPHFDNLSNQNTLKNTVEMHDLEKDIKIYIFLYILLFIHYFIN